MVVLCEHLHIFIMAGEVEDMRPGGSLNTMDIGIHPGFDSPAHFKWCCDIVDVRFSFSDVLF
jgi:hypothetical protein